MDDVARTTVEPAPLTLNKYFGFADGRRTMNPRTQTLKQLVSQQSYPIDESAIAEAIIVRCMARHTVPGIVFHAARRSRRSARFAPTAVGPSASLGPITPSRAAT